MATIPLSFGGADGSGSSDVTASRMHVVNGYTAITSDSNDEPGIGMMIDQGATTYDVASSDRKIFAGQYLSGPQTIRGVAITNLSAANIKKGAVVKIGDANDDGRLANITGSYTTVSSGQKPVVASAMLSGYSGFADGSDEVKGDIQSKAAATYNTSSSDQTIAAGQYLSGAQTIKAVTTSNISAANIKKGVTVTVGDANDADRIATATGSYTTISSGQKAVVAAAMVSGYSGFANGGSEVKGSITAQAATTYNTSTSDRTIAAGTFLTGAATIKAVTTSGIAAGNIKKGVTITVGDANDADRIATATGTYTAISSGQTACTSMSMRTGYSGFANGSGEVKGAADTAANTYNTSSSNRTISAPRYLTGVQTIKAVKTSNLSAANIKKGVTAQVGDAGDADRVASVAGTYTTVSSGQAAVIANAMISGYSGFANGGGEVKGAVTNLAAQTITPGTTNKTIAAGKLTTGVQTIAGDADLVAANIKTGVKIFNVTGNAAAIASYTGTIKSSTGSTSAAFINSEGSTVTRPYIDLKAHAITPAAMVIYYNRNHGVCDGTTMFLDISSGYYAFKATTSPAVWSKAEIKQPCWGYDVTYAVRVAGY